MPEEFDTARTWHVRYLRGEEETIVGHKIFHHGNIATIHQYRPGRPHGCITINLNHVMSLREVEVFGTSPRDAEPQWERYALAGDERGVFLDCLDCDDSVNSWFERTPGLLDVQATARMHEAQKHPSAPAPDAETSDTPSTSH